VTDWRKPPCPACGSHATRVTWDQLTDGQETIRMPVVLECDTCRGTGAPQPGVVHKAAPAPETEGVVTEAPPPPGRWLTVAMERAVLASARADAELAELVHLWIWQTTQAAWPAVHCITLRTIWLASSAGPRPDVELVYVTDQDGNYLDGGSDTWRDLQATLGSWLPTYARAAQLPGGLWRIRAAGTGWLTGPPT